MKWAPLFVALLFLALAAIWLTRDRALAQHAYAEGSSLNSGPEGLSLARDWLASQGARVSLLERDVDPLALPANAVIFRIAPQPPIYDERPQEELNPLRHASDGGVAQDAGSDLDGGAEITNPTEADGIETPGETAVDGGSIDGGVARRNRMARLLAERLKAELLRRASFDPFLLSSGDEELVRRGATLVVAAQPQHAQSSDLTADAGTVVLSDRDGEKVLPIWPEVHTLALSKQRSLPGSALIDAQPVFEVEGHPAIARRLIGKGELWLLDTSLLFENDHLGEHDHLALLAALAGNHRPVLFDESVHGLQNPPGVVDLLRRWGFFPALFLLSVACGLAFWRGAVTVGEPADEFRDTRSEAVDYVDSAASLFDRALTPADALLLYRAHIVREIALRLAVSSAQAEKRFAALMPGASSITASKAGESISPREFQAQLKLCTKALERFRDEHPQHG